MACSDDSEKEASVREASSYYVEPVDETTVKLVVNQEIIGLRPEMVNWWWDNINTTERYKMWHLSDHISFEWLTEPDNPHDLSYSVGAVQQVVEFIGETETHLVITWLDPATVAHEVS